MDDNGYPTEENLKFVEDFNIFKTPVYELIDYLESNAWHFADWGFKYSTEFNEIAERKYNLSMSTGGWSGNEEVMQVLRKNRFYMMFFIAHLTGGHYYFMIPDEWYTGTIQKNVKLKP